jgi:hypothetical protein
MAIGRLIGRRAGDLIISVEQDFVGRRIDHRLEEIRRHASEKAVPGKIETADRGP